MFATQMCPRVTLVLSLVLVWFASPGAEIRAAPQDTSDKAKEIKAVLQERLEVRYKIVDILMVGNKGGIGVNINLLMDAGRDVLKATLELEDSPETRVAALKKCLRLTEEIAAIADVRRKAGTGTQVEVLQATAIMLETRIELLREEIKVKPAK
jgi:hypothetical protein